MSNVRRFGVSDACCVIMNSSASIAIADITLNVFLTRDGTFGARMSIMRGRVMNTAIAVEESSAVDTMMGILLMNSPMIPVANSRGANAHTVVMVVVQIGTMKSLHTSNPVSCTVNLPFR